FFVGDSFVAGVGDPQHRGWVGRLAERAHRIGAPITAYNLGVRRDTSDDILRRWADEVAVRRAAGAQERLVVSFGVNDTTDDGRATRVAPEYSVGNLHTLLADAAAAGLPALMVGPPPVADRVQNRRIAALDAQFAAVCASTGAPYVTVFAPLRDAPVWMDEVAAGDGAHPAAAGYDLLTELVEPAWQEWLLSD
ncbi:MAG TPA: GDSL-type esterase/lipase family protein, partial [Pseudonocardia sp.]|nr:GDSL-type esterase/lipase family protein [Pseudonocardia sp.]